MDLTKIAQLIDGEPTLAAAWAAVLDHDASDMEDTTASESGISTIIDWFNEPQAFWQDVPISAFAGHCDLYGLTEKAENAVGPAAALGAKVVRLVTRQSAIESFELTDETKRGLLVGMLDALVAGGVWTQAEADGVLALGQVNVPRWQSEGVGMVGRGAVLLAKRGAV